jgi:hypothetical protein
LWWLAVGVAVAIREVAVVQVDTDQEQNYL